jgi:quercetin dioxygenase-like cupin family protein
MMSVACVAVLGGCQVNRSAVANGEPRRTKAARVLTHEIPREAGTEGRVLTVEYPPGVSSPSHRHDGAIFAYVAEGAVITALDDGQETRFEAGQAWFERPGQVHRVARNASDSRPAKLVVFYVTEPGKPVLRPEK